MAVAPQKVLVVGAGMATAYFLQEWWQLGGCTGNWQITVVGAEAEACYNRVLLSSLLAGEVVEKDLSLLTDTHLGVSMITGVEVINIDLAAGEARLSNQTRVAFDHLVFATGAEAALPTLTGIESTGIGVLRTLADCRDLHQRAGTGQRAVVVGGGLLGLEAAHGLNQLGCDTSVVHRQPWLMNRQLDEQGARRLETALRDQGMNFLLSARTASVRVESEAVTALVLEDGRELSCDLLVFATGITPRVGLAAQAGVATKHGILVDNYLRTDRKNVWALGECCQLGEHLFGLVAPVREQAGVLARSLLELPVEGFVPGSYPTQLKISGIDIYSDGDLQGDAEELILDDDSTGVYRRLRLRDNRLVGAVLVGDKQGGNWYSNLIQDRVDVGPLRRGLIFGPEISQALAPQSREAA